MNMDLPFESLHPKKDWSSSARVSPNRGQDDPRPTSSSHLANYSIIKPLQTSLVNTNNREERNLNSNWDKEEVVGVSFEAEESLPLSQIGPYEKCFTHQSKDEGLYESYHKYLKKTPEIHIDPGVSYSTMPKGVMIKNSKSGGGNRNLNNLTMSQNSTSYDSQQNHQRQRSACIIPRSTKLSLVTLQLGDS